MDGLAVDEDDPAAVIARTIDEETLWALCAVRRGERPRLVVVAIHIDDAALSAAAEAGVTGLVSVQLVARNSHGQQVVGVDRRRGACSSLGEDFVGANATFTTRIVYSPIDASRIDDDAIGSV